MIDRVAQPPRKTRRAVALVAAILIAIAGRHAVAAPEHLGQVTFNGVPVPGAMVTATQGDKKLSTTTNQQGLYRFTDLADGAWTLRVEMVGFAPATRELTIAADAQPATWELTLLPFEEIARNLPRQTTPATAAPPTLGAPTQGATAAARQVPNRPAQTGGGFKRADVTATARNSTAPPAPPAQEPAPDSSAAADGMLINGSVNNGAASPFAQPAAFGNNRRAGRSLYNYMIGTTLGNSAWDARQFSFTGAQAPKPSYNDTHFLATFGGPLKIPGMLQRRPNIQVLGFQHTEDHNATSGSTLVPTLLERSGNFSQSVDAFGRAITVRNPLTGQPFADNQIPADRLSAQAAALLRLYPDPNFDGSGRNYQATVLTVTKQDSVQLRVAQPLNNRNQLFGTMNYQRTLTDTRSLLSFEDRTRTSVVDTNVMWMRRINQFFNIRPRFQFTQQTNATTPFFAGRTNVSGDAGIAGNDQDPANWGPPALLFSSGILGLSDARTAFSRTRSETSAAEAYWYKGRHNLTIGGDVRLIQTDVRNQQDPRGSFTFNGAFTGSDFGDFLLGLPRTTSIAFGNADKFFRSRQFDAYVNDDLRLSPSFTVMLGARWEYEAPITEKLGRLVNLDVASGFAGVAPVVATDPTGALTNHQYAKSLLSPDKLGIQPRLALAWRPVPGSSLVVRAGYGIYRNTNVYQPIANLLAQQPPLSRSFSVENSAANPVTLANAFTAAAPVDALNTFAVDPDFRVGYAQNWQASVQRDLPMSMTVTASYLGTHGAHLLQEFLPNTYAPGTANPCPACPVGFIYLTSDGTSDRHAAQLQLRRRLRNGLTWSTNYTLSKSDDDATSFVGASLSGAAIAQNWLDLDAERGPSSFDQRHLLTAQVQYTTGVGVAGGGLLTGLKGTLIKGWTITTDINTGSGLPVTPVVLTQVPGTGVIGSIRANLTGVSVTDIPGGYYLNPAAYGIPVGQWGTAGRNSGRGPAQFGMNMSVTRTFTMNTRYNLDWRIDARNVLNRVTYSSIGTAVGSPTFGLPTGANTMRKIQTTVRLRF